MIIINILEAHAASIFCPEDRGRIALCNVDARLRLYLKYV
jgi:hypothetical protein